MAVLWYRYYHRQGLTILIHASAGKVSINSLLNPGEKTGPVNPAAAR